ncbi:hypothetical protein NX02_14000 [Sphingomonas sanxanigenens DSM 19645 = NX02]|uniref:Small-conductance mechanosensitive channel n=1 Tax=Sphingomonas sanxanigenens DSM 19645 = NX02 TaxID=1123269 RepID=W0ABP2_9SPHN|nr:hypothetical protein NX02_14000 [Sphingomonas sanxanigenens DSM 19645 = NX02]
MDAARQFQAMVDESVAWLGDNWLRILIALGAAALIVLLLRAARGWSARLCDRRESGNGWLRIAGATIGRTTNFFIVMAAARLVAGYAALPPLLDRTIGFLFTLAAAFQAAIWAREFILGAIERRTRSDAYHGEALLNAMGLIRLLISCVVFAIALVVVLDNLGVNVTGLVAGLGVGGIAIGLAAQGIFADLFAALAIIFDRPFRRGDNIQFGTSSGTIEEIGLKSTRIRAFSGEERIISNKSLLDKEILNTTRRNHIRVAMPMLISYRTPTAQLEKLPAMVSEIVTEQGATAARSGFGGLRDSAIGFELEVDFPGTDWGAAHAGRDRIVVALLRRFEEDGIEIGLPAQTSYIAGLPEAPAVALRTAKGATNGNLAKHHG